MRAVNRPEFQEGRTLQRGIALAGGAARGFAHIGALKAVEESGLPVAAVAGTSMGAIIGSLWASGMPADEILELARKTSWLRLINFRPGGGLLSAGKLRDFLGRYLPRDFEGLERPFAAVATDAVRGRSVYLHRGDLPSAVLASAAYPGLFSAVERDGLQLIDGGVLDNLPVDAARFLGSEWILAVDVTYDPDHEQDPPTGLLELGRRAVDLMQARLTQARLAMNPPDAYVRPDLRGIGLEHFGKLEEIWPRGYEAAKRVLDEVIHERS